MEWNKNQRTAIIHSPSEKHDNDELSLVIILALLRDSSINGAGKGI